MKLSELESVSRWLTKDVELEVPDEIWEPLRDQVARKFDNGFWVPGLVISVQGPRAKFVIKRRKSLEERVAALEARASK